MRCLLDKDKNQKRLFQQRIRKMKKKSQDKIDTLNEADLSHVIELGWRDEVSFDDIQMQTGLLEKEVIEIMRTNMKPSSFRMWRKRVSGRAQKHEKQIHDQ